MNAKNYRTNEEKKLWLEFVVPQINLQHGGVAVGALQSMTYLGLAHSSMTMAKQAEEFAALTKPTDKQKVEYKLSKLMHEIISEPAKAAVDAATIIYAHAILDATIYKLCSISISIDSNAWIPLIEKRQVAFSEIRLNNDISIVQKKLLENYLAQLERESLLFKCDILFKHVKPKHTRGILKGFKYSRERLASLDKLRHDLVHKLEFHRKSRQAKAKTNYLLNTGQFFVNLISKHYGVVMREIPKQEQREDLFSSRT
ncbi:MAG: hypothetical protein ABSE97_03035 [Verrucomicrobiota bacterium]|jgi:hypothetical protein